jgi:hypothetical protein
VGALSDPDSAAFTIVPDEDVTAPVVEYDTKGLTKKQYDAIFNTPLVSDVQASSSPPEEPSLSFQSGMPRDLKDYWLRGEGALKVRWGTEGSFRRCVKELNEYFPLNTEGLCANLYHEATGHWPGEDRKK